MAAMVPQPGHRSFLQLHKGLLLSRDSSLLLEPLHSGHSACSFMHPLWPLAVRVHPTVVSQLCCVCVCMLGQRDLLLCVVLIYT